MRGAVALAAQRLFDTVQRRADFNVREKTDGDFGRGGVAVRHGVRGMEVRDEKKQRNEAGWKGRGGGVRGRGEDKWVKREGQRSERKTKRRDQYHAKAQKQLKLN